MTQPALFGLEGEKIPSVALVTGGARRIGREIVLELARLGFDIALHFKGSRQDAQKTAQDARALGRYVRLYDVDLADPNAAADMLMQVVADFGALGVLINNASLFEKDDWQTASCESWAAHMSVNLESPFRLSQAFAKSLPKDLHGVIVNIIDQRVFNLTPHFISYTLSKSGLWTLTRTLALALAPHIRVAGVGPGPTAPSPRQNIEDFEKQWAAIPLQRRTRPAAIGRAVRFILEAPGFTGQMLALDGGEHLGWQQDSLGNYVDE